MRLDRATEVRLQLLFFTAVFSDVHDLVLEDKQIRRAFASQADHVAIVVFDPAAHHLPVHQFDRDWFLLLAE